jgi:hypothetical protein
VQLGVCSLVCATCCVQLGVCSLVWATWSLTLSEVHTLRVFEDRVPRGVWA